MAVDADLYRELRRLARILDKLPGELKAALTAESIQATKEVPDEEYTVHVFNLAEARSDQEVCDGWDYNELTVLSAGGPFSIKLNSSAAKAIPVAKNQTLTIRHKIDRFYFSNAAGTGEAVIYLSRWHKLEE